MNYDPTKHHRQSIRLKDYDYSLPGVYFVTVVAHEHTCMFGEIKNGEMCLNQFGQIVRHAWFDLPCHYMRVELGTFCIMPNHIHGIIILNENSVVVGAGLRPAPTNITHPHGRYPLSEIVRAFKSFSSRRINAARKLSSVPVWQRNYYEHIIRSDDEYKRIQFYIETNPGNWISDDDNPERY